MEHHAAYERFVLRTLVPFIRQDCRSPGVRMIATGCSVGALYSSLFVLKHPETFGRALCLSGRYRASSLFGGRSSHDVYLNDPLAFLPGLRGAALERVRAQAHLTVVVGRGRFEEGCILETAELGAVLARKGIPHHLAFWGTESSHTYPWCRKQALHYLRQMV